MEIPGKIEFIGERGDPSRPWTRPLVLRYDDFLPRLLEALKGHYLVVGFGTVVMAELRLSAIAADLVELARNAEIRKHFAEVNPNENKEFLLKSTQPLTIKRTAELFHEPLPEDLRQQTLMFYRCYLRVRQRVEQAIDATPKNSRIWNVVPALDRCWNHYYLAPVEDFTLLESVLAENEYRMSEERRSRRRSREQTSSSSRSSTPAPPEMEWDRNESASAAMPPPLPLQPSYAHSQQLAQQSHAQPLQSQSFPFASVQSAVGLAETAGVTLIHFGPLFHPNKSTLDQFIRDWSVQPTLFKVFLYYLKSAGLLTEFEYTEIIMRLAIGDRVLIGISLSANPSAVAHVIESIETMSAEDYALAARQVSAGHGEGHPHLFDPFAQIAEQRGAVVLREAVPAESLWRPGMSTSTSTLPVQGYPSARRAAVVILPLPNVSGLVPVGIRAQEASSRPALSGLGPASDQTERSGQGQALPAPQRRVTPPPVASGVESAERSPIGRSPPVRRFRGTGSPMEESQNVETPSPVFESARSARGARGSRGRV